MSKSMAVTPCSFQLKGLILLQKIEIFINMEKHLNTS